MGIGDWGLGIGDWGLGIGPMPNPQSPPEGHIRRDADQAGRDGIRHHFYPRQEQPP